MGGGEEQTHTRSFLKIQDGCNSFCTYCIIPFARGKSRSIPAQELVKRIQALEGAGVSVDPALVRFGQGSEPYGFKYALELMQEPEPPTAIFCANDRTAWGAYQALLELGKRVPEDVSIIGFDNQETLAPHLRPGLTTLELPFEQMGRRAVDLILEGIKPQGQVELMACSLIERNSVEKIKESQ